MADPDAEEFWSRQDLRAWVQTYLAVEFLLEVHDFMPTSKTEISTKGTKRIELTIMRDDSSISMSR